jgi:hypothetical protein
MIRTGTNVGKFANNPLRLIFQNLPNRQDQPMHWIAPSEKDSANATLEKRLWDAADQFRANSGLKPQEYSGPIPLRGAVEQQS